MSVFSCQLSVISSGDRDLPGFGRRGAVVTRLWDSEDILEIAFRDAAAISMRRWCVDRPSRSRSRLIARITRCGWATRRTPGFSGTRPGQLGLTLLGFRPLRG